MIRMVQSRSSQGAKAYFESGLINGDGLNRANYYINQQEIPGKIYGLLAGRIGMSGSITKEQFFDLCDNINPVNKDKLTAHTKENRTVGYDICFNIPKSCSIVHMLSNDNHIQDAFEKCVQDTMKDIERDVLTRVRKDGKNEERQTGELLYSTFIHQTARPTPGFVQDPLLHAHCFVFNCTFDSEEQTYKAIQFREINRNMPLYQAQFHKRFSDALMDLGYDITREGASYEISGISKEAIELFSKRKNQIDKIAIEKGVKGVNALGELGARTREKKNKDLTMDELIADWKRQLKELELSGIVMDDKPIRHTPKRETRQLSGRDCIEYSIAHNFERASVATEAKILADACIYSVGCRTVTIEDIKKAFESDSSLIRVSEKGIWKVTTKAVLKEEKRMIELARMGQGKLKPLYLAPPLESQNGQREKAINHILTTTNRVSIVMGAAGSGKTTLMQEAARLIEKAGKQVFVVAPTAEASRGVLRSEGFEQAETVAKLLTDTKMQESLKDQVLWVDEAGMLSVRDMAHLLQIASEKNSRIVLGGDSKQHSSILRGDALRVLNSVGGIAAAEVTCNYRQKSDTYRKIVEDLAKGDVKSGFNKLDQMGAILELDHQSINSSLVKDYMHALRDKKSVLIVSPTHKQIDSVTEELRLQLKADKIIGKKDVPVDRLTNRNLTNAEKSNWQSYKSGEIVQFSQNVPGISRGSVWIVVQASETGVKLQNSENRTVQLPLDRGKNFDVFEKTSLNLSKGDKVKITRGGFDKGSKRLDNGQTLTVVSVHKNGDIKLHNEKSRVKYRLGKDFGHLAHAYCHSSYSAQGKTAEVVLISQPVSTMAATNARQFYVSVSRGRQQVRVYTDDKEQLLEHAAMAGDRQSALELVGQKSKDSKNRTLEHSMMKINQAMQERQIKQESHRITQTVKDYEPSI